MLSVQEKLKSKNPFLSNIAEEPWGNSFSDVPLNQKVCEEVCRLIEQKSATPTIPLAGTVLGEGGAGKTHFLKRILGSIQNKKLPVFFVFVKPQRDPEGWMRHLLQEIVVNMLKKGSAEHNQFSVFIDKVFQQCDKDLAGFKNFNLFPNNVNSTINFMIRWFKLYHPALDSDLLRVLFIYRNDQDKPIAQNRQTMVLEWLEGRIHEDHSKELGVTDRALRSEAALEAEAEKIVHSLGILLAYSRMSMLLCFDQLEAIRGPVIRSFGDMIQTLVNDTQALFPLAFIRQTVWDERFEGGLDITARARLCMHTFELANCTADDARKILRTRIEDFWGSGSKESGEIYAWLLSRVDSKILPFSSPRSVIELANKAIQAEEGKASPPSEAVAVLEEEYQKSCQKVAANMAIWPPNRERLVMALRYYLENKANYRDVQEAAFDPAKKYIGLTASRVSGGQNIPSACLINVAENGNTVLAVLRRGEQFLSQNPGAECFYITDDRCMFGDETRWKQVHAQKKTFEKLGGKMLFLNHDRRVRWYGLTALIDEVETENVRGDGGTVTGKDLASYLGQRFSCNLLEEAPSTGLNPPSPPSTDELKACVVAQLKGSPMRILQVSIVYGNLPQRQGISYDEFLTFLGEQEDSLRLYPCGDGSMVQLIS